MPIKKLREYLDSHNIEYVTIHHSQAFNAQRIAASAHIKGKNLAKTVMVIINGKMAMAVLPASYHINFELLKQVTGTEDVLLANEMEFKHRFPDCEIGAMPPFGNLYDMEVFVAESLAQNDLIAFNAGNHTELIQMVFKDYQDLVNPRILKFSSTNA